LLREQYAQLGLLKSCKDFKSIEQGVILAFLSTIRTLNKVSLLKKENKKVLKAYCSFQKVPRRFAALWFYFVKP
jgi:hypothetical protein